MPYADLKKQRAYQREWKARRRATWIKENGPCAECGSTKRLEVHHTDPKRALSLVEPEGIEPSSLPCQRSVLPLNDGPIGAVEETFSSSLTKLGISPKRPVE
jgi:hypothetical protein